MVDLGVAAFKHFRTRNFYTTPLIGVHGTGLNFDDTDFSQTFGVRADVALTWLLGPQRRHALSLTPGLNFYLPSEDTFGQESDAAANFSVTVGYTLRFTTPFGQTSLITFE